MSGDETAQEVRDEINRIVGIGQSIDQPGYFTKDELRDIATHIAELEDKRSVSTGTEQSGGEE